jgi:hypothetical protein
MRGIRNIIDFILSFFYDNNRRNILLFLEIGRRGVHTPSSCGKKNEWPTGRQRRNNMNDKYDQLSFEDNKHSHNPNIGPHLHFLEYDERFEFLDKIITSAIKMSEEYPKFGNGNHNPFDGHILENMELCFSAMETKFLSPLRNKYRSWEIPRDFPGVQDAYAELRRVQAEFAIKKLTMIQSVPNATNRGVLLKEPQQKLLQKIAEAWIQENDPDKAEYYMTAIIITAKKEDSDMASVAIRESDKSCAKEEKIIQAIEMCNKALSNEKNMHAQKRLNSLVQTLAIGWVKSLKSPDEILGRIKAKVAASSAKKSKKQ